MRKSIEVHTFGFTSWGETHQLHRLSKASTVTFYFHSNSDAWDAYRRLIKRKVRARRIPGTTGVEVPGHQLRTAVQVIKRSNIALYWVEPSVVLKEWKKPW